MIVRVLRIAQKSKLASRVIVATDNEEIAKVVRLAGGEAIMTSPKCKNGTERVAEVVRMLPEPPKVVVNLQGDAVLTPYWILDELIQSSLRESECPILTPIYEVSGDELKDLIARKKSGSKTTTLSVFDVSRKALYFSKTLIPFSRDTELAKAHVHIGIYAYTPEGLETLSSLPPSYLESIEQLEQLRALENGIPIRVVPVNLIGKKLASVDAPIDIQNMEKIIFEQGEL